MILWDPNNIIILLLSLYRESTQWQYLGTRDVCFRDSGCETSRLSGNDCRRWSVFGRVFRTLLDAKRVWVLGPGRRFLGGGDGCDGRGGERSRSAVVDGRRRGQRRGLQRQGQRHGGGSGGRAGRSADQSRMSVVRHRSVPVGSGLVTSALEQPETVGTWRKYLKNLLRIGRDYSYNTILQHRKPEVGQIRLRSSGDEPNGWPDDVYREHTWQ